MKPVAKPHQGPSPASYRAVEALARMVEVTISLGLISDASAPKGGR